MKIKCPICRKKTEWKDNPNRPFCSERCKLIDLGKWASEEYRFKGKEFPEESNNEKD
ncbi:MAG TPA: DNA gyrase inhibitor YacG [Nitrospirae bacterium]|nr:DNA gyrase inhibitor YacG [Nitrospirota bacterium]